MGQQEVYNLLKKHKNKWLSAREVAKLQGASFNIATSNLRRLRKRGVIMFKTVVRVVKPAGKRPFYVYKYKKWVIEI